LLDPLFIPLLCDHRFRDALDYLDALGFSVEGCERST